MKNKNIYIALLALLLSFAACEDGLEKYPLDRPSDVNYLSSKAEMEMAITSCYNSLWMGLGYGLPDFQMSDCLSDIAWERADATFQTLGNGSHDSNNSVVSTFWNKYYQAIGRSNFIIENIARGKDKVTAEEYNRYIADAKFLRAYWYHKLTEYFGDVPLLVKPVSSLAETQVAKTPKAEITSLILKDLDDAAKDLPLTVKASEKGRATRGAALALKTRVALLNSLWEIAAQAATDLTNLGLYSLDESFDGLFKKNGQSSSKEIIFSLQYKFNYYNWSTSGTDTRMGQGYSSKIPTQSLVDSYECKDGLSIDKSPLFNLAKPYQNRDPRLNSTIVVPGSVFAGYQFETHKDSVVCWNYNTTPPTRVANQDALNAYASFSGYCWRKYSEDDKSLGTGISEVSHIVLRYADVLLMYAEAKIELNQIDESVYDAINKVRQRVNMPVITSGKTQAELRSIVRKERKYELAWEGVRLFDIRRWKLAEKVMVGPLFGRIPKGILASAPVIDEFGTPNYDNVSNKSSMRVIEMRAFNKNRDYLFPIPRLEVETNKLLTQNPGY
jgi:hypothetical protein